MLEKEILRTLRQHLTMEFHVAAFHAEARHKAMVVVTAGPVEAEQIGNVPIKVDCSISTSIEAICPTF